MWGLYSLDRKYIMKHDLEKMTACVHWVTRHELQIIQSEFILLFSFKWLFCHLLVLIVNCATSKKSSI